MSDRATADAEVALVLSRHALLGTAIIRALERDGWEVIAAAGSPAGWVVADGSITTSAAMVAHAADRGRLGALVAVMGPLTRSTFPPLAVAGDEVGAPEGGGTPTGDATWVTEAAELATPGMVDRGTGRLVFVTSTAGRVGDAGAVVAGANESVLFGLARGLARALGPAGVTANVVAHGTLADDAVEASVTALAHVGRRRDPNAPPLGETVTTGDVAEAVAFLVSGDAAFVTGATLPVDGGASIGF